jgi:hypothetical protein
LEIAIMANATGRPTAALVLSSDERDYLERQVRRHRVARSLSEQCRIILRCEDSVPSKLVAAELGVHEHTVGKWRRRFLKDRIEGLLHELRGRPAPQGLSGFSCDGGRLNYATHKTPATWLARRPRYHVHFTPTSASWINQVERWFAELTRKKLRRGVHTSTSQLEADIRSFIDRHNQNPKPYKWTKSADEILATVKRFCQKTEQSLCGEF